MDKLIGEKRKSAIYYVYDVPKSLYKTLLSFHAVSTFLFPNCSRGVQQYKTRKGDPKPCPKGEWL
jgi:hypothetical protein